MTRDSLSQIHSIPLIKVDTIVLTDSQNDCANPYTDCPALATISVGLRQISSLSFISIVDTSDPAQLDITITDTDQCGQSHTLSLESYDKFDGATLLVEDRIIITVEECQQSDLITSEGDSLEDQFNNVVENIEIELEIIQDYLEDNNLSEVEIVHTEEDGVLSVTVNFIDADGNSSTLEWELDEEDLEDI